MTSDPDAQSRINRRGFLSGLAVMAAFARTPRRAFADEMRVNIEVFEASADLDRRYQMALGVYNRAIQINEDIVERSFSLFGDKSSEEIQNMDAMVVMGVQNAVDQSLEDVLAAEKALNVEDDLVLTEFEERVLALSAHDFVVLCHRFEADDAGVTRIRRIAQETGQNLVMFEIDINRYPTISKAYADHEGNAVEIQMVRNGQIHNGHIGDFSLQAVRGYFQKAIDHLNSSSFSDAPSQTL